MAKRVIGVYEGEIEAKEVVESLEKEGYQPFEVVLMTNDADTTSWLRDETDAKVDSADAHHTQTDGDNASFWKKVKEAAKGNISFHGKDLDNSGKSLVEYGLTPEQADVYKSEIQDGKVLVLVPEEPSQKKQSN
ncbi:general stress protein [Alkalicoccus saliphilus]|jgi:hypothetical protein|uniref:General stress protein 17M-like domain-containing protein n=1 Tax=Alkalicoccus saliphilus TaxID=200989 RepID=A0A2T4U4L0_9BACI|nr:general stress protein [Alkalicoccus saliphilus]PTL38295.1 hypothetical protein C6Y45_12285 [Alkalicoccus saliphilus]